MATKIAKTADRKKEMDTTKSTDCPKCGKPTRIVKRVKDRRVGFQEEFLFPARLASFTRSSNFGLCALPSHPAGARTSGHRYKLSKPTRLGYCRSAFMRPRISALSLRFGFRLNASSYQCAAST